MGVEALNTISLCAYAKLNLYLDITGKRDDGYHLLETVMQSIDLCDIVTIRTGGRGISVRCSDPEIPADGDNICFKAAELFYDAVGRSPDCEIFIEKRIPWAAGMGGGSADAAAAIVGLNALMGEPLDTEGLLRVAAKTGADVPFCVTGGTKLCGGIGDEIRGGVELPEYVYLVVMPDFRCDTRAAYASYDSAPLPRRNALERFTGSGEDFPKMLYNVFGELYKDDRLNGIIARLGECGARGACLTGSGAAVFGVFDGEQAAADAAGAFPSCFTAVSKPMGYGVRQIM